MKNIWFGSDMHLGHNKILKYDKRPFENIQKHDALIINNYNKLVQPEDDFYYLGDFSFNDKHTEGYLQQLQGNKYFIRGNHDRKQTIKLYEKYGIYLGDMYSGLIDDTYFVLCHYAMRVWNKSHKGAIHLYGHSHGNLPDLKDSLSMDVGIMNNNYYPFSIREVKAVMAKKEFKPVDHHGK